jgi:Flp pilus assembly protein TadG
VTSFRSPKGKWQDHRGQTFILFVFFLIVLILFIGLAVDVGFAYITKASLSKAVDAAGLAGMVNLSQGTLTAQNVAADTFRANYGTPGRDAASSPALNAPTITWSVDAANNKQLNVDATAVINTFFIRILPQWKTLNVSAHAQATRAPLVLAMVLDRSGSMSSDGGAGALPGAVAGFIGQFDDTVDRSAMASFSCAASTDVTMRQPFKSAIINAANAMPFGGFTCSERGLTNGLAQINSYSVPANANVIKAIVFFTDGVANTFYFNFNCGPRNIEGMDGNRTLYDPNAGTACNVSSTGCTVPTTITSIDGVTRVSTTSCQDMHIEAEKRAEAVARLARSQGIFVYSIGLGSGYSECGFPALNPDFLKNVANTTDSQTYDPTQPVGAYAIAANASQMNQVFQEIAGKILLRLTQ